MTDYARFLAHAIGHIVARSNSASDFDVDNEAVGVLKRAIAQLPASAPPIDSEADSASIRGVSRGSGYYMSVAETARYLDRSDRMVRAMLKKGYLPGKQVNPRLWMIKRADVVAWKKAHPPKAEETEVAAGAAE